MLYKLSKGKNMTPITIPVEKIDLFIDRCILEKGHTLTTLGQEIKYTINPPMGNTIMLQIGMVEILPLVLRRIGERLENEQ